MKSSVVCGDSAYDSAYDSVCAAVVVMPASNCRSAYHSSVSAAAAGALPLLAASRFSIDSDATDVVRLRSGKLINGQPILCGAVQSELNRRLESLLVLPATTPAETENISTMSRAIQRQRLGKSPTCHRRVGTGDLSPDEPPPDYDQNSRPASAAATAKTAKTAATAATAATAKTAKTAATTTQISHLPSKPSQLGRSQTIQNPPRQIQPLTNQARPPLARPLARPVQHQQGLVRRQNSELRQNGTPNPRGTIIRKPQYLPPGANVRATTATNYSTSLLTQNQGNWSARPMATQAQEYETLAGVTGVTGVTGVASVASAASAASVAQAPAVTHDAFQRHGPLKVSTLNSRANARYTHSSSNVKPKWQFAYNDPSRVNVPRDNSGYAIKTPEVTRPCVSPRVDPSVSPRVTKELRRMHAKEVKRIEREEKLRMKLRQKERQKEKENQKQKRKGSGKFQHRKSTDDNIRDIRDIREMGISHYENGYVLPNKKKGWSLWGSRK